MDEHIQPDCEPKNNVDTRGFAGVAFDFLEMVAWALFVIMLVFTFAIRLCRVEGQSMENTLHNNQLLLTNSFFYEPEQDDIIVFHLTIPEINMEKTLVKRVIATGGQHLEINFSTNEIFVDGVRYADTHSVLKDFNDRMIGYYISHPTGANYNNETGIYSVTVPEGCLFVLGDNRNNSNDSRNPAIGFVDESCVLGKVIFSVNPFESVS